MKNSKFKIFSVFFCFVLFSAKLAKFSVLKAVFHCDEMLLWMKKEVEKNVSKLFAMIILNGPELICNCEYTYH